MPYILTAQDAYKNLEITLLGNIGSTDARIDTISTLLMRMHTTMPLDTFELAKQPDGTFKYEVVTVDGREFKQTVRPVDGVRYLAFDVDTETEWTVEELQTHEPLRAAMFRLIQEVGATKFECSFS